MNNQQEMIWQLEFLWSSLMRKPLSSSNIFHRTIEEVVNQIGSEEFVYDEYEYKIKGYNDGRRPQRLNSINNKFEPIDKEEEEEEIREGVIYKGTRHNDQYYIFAAIRIAESDNRYFVLYCEYSHSHDMRWNSSGVRGWKTGGTVNGCAKKWLGGGVISILKGYSVIGSGLKTLNYSKSGFIKE